MSSGAPALGRAEREVLLRCARVELEDVGALRRLLEGSLDWEAIVFHARLHSVAPLLHHHVSANAPGRVPRDAARSLLALRHRAGYQNALFSDEHRAVVDAVHAAGIPVTVQKGLAVIELLYRRLDLRPLVDLIFLVPPGRRNEAAAAVAALGYEQEPLHPADRVYRWSCPQSVLWRAGRLEVTVIFQDDLISWPRVHALRPGDVWARTGTGQLAGQRVRMLDPTDMLLYLCVQADNHGHFNRVGLGEMDSSELLFADWSNNRLVRFTDLYEAARRLPWDPDALVERAHASGLSDAVRTSLTLTNELLGEAAPASLLERLDRGRRRRLRRLVFGALAASERGNHPAPLRAAGRAWRSTRPRTQIRLARLVGLAEYATPSPLQLRLRYRLRSRGPA